MNLKNGLYINSMYVNDIIFKDVPKIEDRKYFITFNDELIEVNSSDINFNKFVIVPGFRIIPTIEENAETTIKYNNEVLYFENEHETRYLLNIEKIFTIECVNTVFYRIVTVDNEEFWIKAFNENFKHFTNKLIN